MRGSLILVCRPWVTVAARPGSPVGTWLRAGGAHNVAGGAAQEPRGIAGYDASQARRQGVRTPVFSRIHLRRPLSKRRSPARDSHSTS